MIGSNPMHVDMYSLEVANIPNFIQFRNQTCAPRQKRDHIWQVKGATQSLAAWCFDLRSWCFLLTMQGTRWKKGTREIHWIWLFSAFRKVCKSPLGRAGKIEIAVQSRKITLGKSIRRTPNFQELVMFAMYQGNFFASILIRSAFQIGKARSDRSKKKAPTPRAHGWELAACQLPFVWGFKPCMDLYELRVWRLWKRSHLQLESNWILFKMVFFSFPWIMNCIASLHLATQLQYTLQESVLRLIKHSDLMCSYSSTGDTESGGSTARVPLEPALFVDSVKGHQAHMQTWVHACLHMRCVLHMCVYIITVYYSILCIYMIPVSGILPPPPTPPPNVMTLSTRPIAPILYGGHLVEFTEIEYRITSGHVWSLEYLFMP